MSIRLFPYCFVLLLAAFAPGVPGIAAATTEFMVLNDYAQAWADKQEWVYEGMQESDEPVPHREGDAWNQEDSSGLTVLDYALLGASAQELGAVQSMVQLGARPGTGKAEAYLGPPLNPLSKLHVPFWLRPMKHKLNILVNGLYGPKVFEGNTIQWKRRSFLIPCTVS